MTTSTINNHHHIIIFYFLFDPTMFEANPRSPDHPTDTAFTAVVLKVMVLGLEALADD